MTIYATVLEQVTKRMHNTGDYIVGIEGRYYWANTNHSGCLIEAASSNEVASLQQTINAGQNKGILHEFIKR